MISLYSGEMFITPIPLHLSLNYCSHKCSFCFANLNNPGRTADVKKIQSQLKNYNNQNNIAAQLMREKRPVLISNTVDPFATSNYEISRSVIEQLSNLDIPVAIQTRGASIPKADEAMQWVIENTNPSVWYVSITTTSEDTRKKLEPGAPSIDHRFKLVERLLKAGHKVIVAPNPYLKEWIPDLKGYIKHFYKLGIRHSWIGTMHFNVNQLKNMPDRDKSSLGDLARVRKKKEISEDFLSAKSTIGEIGAEFPDYNFFLGLDGKENHFFDLYHETYNHNTFPVFSDFYNWVTKNKSQGDIITFAELMGVFGDKLPSGEHNFSGLAYSAKRADYDKPEVQQAINSLKKCTIDKYVKLLWNDRVFKFKPTIHDGYATIVKDVDGEIDLELDEHGNEKVLYDPVTFHNNEEFVFYNP